MPGTGSGSAGEPPSAGRGRWPKGSIASAAVGALRRASGPLTLDALGAELARERDLGQGWRDRLRGALQQNADLCRVGTATYDLVERRLAGARFRHTLTASEVRHGVLLADPDLDDLVLWWQPFPGSHGRVEWVDGAGPVRPALIGHLLGPRPAGAPAGLGHSDRVYRVLVGLAEWLRAKGARAGDDLCFCPEPPDGRRFRISLERGDGNAAEVREADAALAETALAILQAAQTVVTPRDLLRRLAGRLDLRAGPAVHLPVFVLGRDPRFAFDGVFYAQRALAEALDRRHAATPYPRPEDYPADWPGRDPMAELERYMESRLPEALWRPKGPAAAGSSRDPFTAVKPEVILRASEERAMLWDLLQDRSRLLNPPTGARSATRSSKSNVIRGPWLG